MFLEHFGLREQPFGVTPDPRFLYLGASHREAMASLRYGIEADRGFLAVIARPGMGKTTLLFQLLEQMRSTARTVFVFHTQCGARELLRYILQDAGVDTRETDVVRLHDEFNTLLMHEARSGRRFIIVVDEAQNLDESGLETLRLLSNFETSRAKLLQIVLAGQPQLASKLSAPSLAQFRQRLSIVCRLIPLTPSEVHEYVVHRLRAAGSQRPEIFSPEAMQQIAERSEGIPRNINNLCFNSLSTAFAMDRDVVTSSIVRDVIADLDLQGILEPPSSIIDDDAEERAFASVLADVQDSVPEGLATFASGTPEATGSAELDPVSVPDVCVQLEADAGLDSPLLVEEQVAPEQQKQEPRTTTTAVANEYVHSGFNAARNVEPDTDMFAAWRNLPPPLPVKRTFRLRTVSPRSVLLAFGIGLLVFLLATGAVQWTATGPQESANAAAPEDSLAKPENDNTDVANADAPRRSRGAVGRAKRPATAENGASPSQRFATVQDSRGDFAIPANDQDKSSRASHANTISEENQLAYAASPATPGRDAYVDIVNSQRTPDSTDSPRQLYIPATTARPTGASGARPASASPTLREGKLVSYIKPVYPQRALRSHLEGTVVLRAIISPSGSVRAANHLSGDRLLSAAAIDAVKKWKYEPFLLNGRPTEVEKQISVSFSIPD